MVYSQTIPPEAVGYRDLVAKYVKPSRPYFHEIIPFSSRPLTDALESKFQLPKPSTARTHGAHPPKRLVGVSI